MYVLQVLLYSLITSQRFSRFPTASHNFHLNYRITLIALAPSTPCCYPSTQTWSTKTISLQMHSEPRLTMPAIKFRVLVKDGGLMKGTMNEHCEMFIVCSMKSRCFILDVLILQKDMTFELTSLISWSVLKSTLLCHYSNASLFSHIHHRPS